MKAHAFHGLFIYKGKEIVYYFKYMESPENKPKNGSTTLTTGKNVFYVGLLSFFGGISQDIFSPILPIYFTAVLGFDKTFVGIAEGIVTASSNIFSVISGFFSDKFKKQKPIIFFGYFLSMVGRPLLALFSSGAAVLGLRLVDGIGKGVKDPPKDVLIAGSASKETRGEVSEWRECSIRSVLSPDRLFFSYFCIS